MRKFEYNLLRKFYITYNQDSPVIVNTKQKWGSFLYIIILISSMKSYTKILIFKLEGSSNLRLVFFFKYLNILKDLNNHEYFQEFFFYWYLWHKMLWIIYVFLYVENMSFVNNIHICIHALERLFATLFWWLTSNANSFSRHCGKLGLYSTGAVWRATSSGLEGFGNVGRLHYRIKEVGHLPYEG